MKNSTRYKCYTALILVMGLSIHVPSKAYVTEYACATEVGDQGREIHFLYDDHVGVNGVSPRRMQRQSIDSFKHNFFSTERGFLDVLQSINQTPAARSIDVIWESSTPGYTDEGANEFIAYGSTIIQREFRNLNLIHADLARGRFEAPFLHGFDKRRDAAIYNDPVPLPQQRVTNMKRNSGTQLFNSYMGYYNASLADLKMRFKPHYDNNAQLWKLILIKMIVLTDLLT